MNEYEYERLLAFLKIAYHNMTTPERAGGIIRSIAGLMQSAEAGVPASVQNKLSSSE